MAKRGKQTRQQQAPQQSLNITQSVNIGDQWDSKAFAKLLEEQAKSNETAIKQLEAAMGAAAANQQQLSEQIAQTSMMKDIKAVLIAQLQDKKFERIKQEQIKLKEQEKIRLKQANDQLKENLILRREEAKAIANIAKGMQTFRTMGDRFTDMNKKLKDSFGSMSALKVTALKTFNIGGIFNKSIAKEQFIQTQRKLGSEDDRKTLAGKFEAANKTAKSIKANEEEISRFKKETGLSEADLAKTKEGKRLLSQREQLSDEYSKQDLKASLVKRDSPTQQHAEASSSKEAQLEAQKTQEKQSQVLTKIEENTRAGEDAKKASSSRSGTEKEGGGLLSGLLGGKMGNVLKSMKDFGIGIALVAGGLWVASKAFQSFADVAWEDVGKGMIVLAGFVATAKILKSGMGDMLKASVGIVALSGALWVASKSLGEFASVDWESIGKAGVSLIGLGAAAFLLGKIVPQMLLSAVGLAAMGGGLMVVAMSLEKFEEVGWESMGKAAAAITGLGLASLLLGPAAPLMIAAGAGLAVLGGGLWVVGEAMQAVGQGFKDMTDGIERISTLNGDNMMNVAKGLGAISAAMIAFGGAQALAGIGNLVGKLLSFGQDSPMEQLEKISKYGEGIGKAGAGMKDLGTGMKAFSDIKGDSLSATMKAMKEFPWEQATKFVAAGGTMSANGGAVYNASKSNADSRSQNAGAGGASTTVVNAPVNSKQTTVVSTRRPLFDKDTASTSDHWYQRNTQRRYA